jgi:hypothetical protein
MEATVLTRPAVNVTLSGREAEILMSILYVIVWEGVYGKVAEDLYNALETIGVSDEDNPQVYLTGGDDVMLS